MSRFISLDDQDSMVEFRIVQLIQSPNRVYTIVCARDICVNPPSKSERPCVLTQTNW